MATNNNNTKARASPFTQPVMTSDSRPKTRARTKSPSYGFNRNAIYDYNMTPDTGTVLTASPNIATETASRGRRRARSESPGARVGSTKRPRLDAVTSAAGSGVEPASEIDASMISAETDAATDITATGTTAAATAADGTRTRTDNNDRANNDRANTGTRTQPSGDLTIDDLEGFATDYEPDLMRFQGPEIINDERVNADFEGRPAAAYSEGEIIHFHCYDRVLDVREIDAAKAAIERVRTAVSNGEDRDAQDPNVHGLVGYKNTMFFGHHNLGTDYDGDSRPVVEKLRYMVIISKCETEMICLPIFTHKGRGIDAKPRNSWADYVPVHDMKITDTEREVLLTGFRRSPNRPVRARDTVVELDVLSHIKVTSPVPIAYGMAVRKIGHIDDTCLNYLKTVTMDRGFNLFRPRAAAITNINQYHDGAEQLQLRQRTVLGAEELARQRQDDYLNPANVKKLFEDEVPNPSAVAAFNTSFTQRWEAIANKRMTSGIEAIVYAAASQLSEPHLHPSRDELVRIAGSERFNVGSATNAASTNVPTFLVGVPKLDNPTEKTHVSIHKYFTNEDLNAILSIWAQTQTTFTHPLLLGVWEEGFGPRILGGNPAVQGAKCIWIYNNNIEEIFRRAGLEPKSEVHDHYCGMRAMEAGEIIKHRFAIGIQTISQAWKEAVQAEKDAANAAAATQSTAAENDAADQANAPTAPQAPAIQVGGTPANNDAAVHSPSNISMRDPSTAIPRPN